MAYPLTTASALPYFAPKQEVGSAGPRTTWWGGNSSTVSISEPSYGNVESVVPLSGRPEAIGVNGPFD
jgi:hypothetical protein